MTAVKVKATLLFMLPRHQRLTRQRIELIFKKSRRIVRNSFILKFLSTSQPTSRFCIVVSAKTEPKAVKRNLLRRRIYEILRLNQNLLQKKYDLILTPNALLVESTYQDIEKNIIQLLHFLNSQK